MDYAKTINKLMVEFKQFKITNYQIIRKIKQRSFADSFLYLLKKRLEEFESRLSAANNAMQRLKIAFRKKKYCRLCFYRNNKKADLTLPIHAKMLLKQMEEGS